MKATLYHVPVIATLFALAACAEPSSEEMLQRRVTDRLNPVQSCNSQARVDYLPNGARVRIPDAALFQVGRTDLSACGEFALASTVEAMLDPNIMQVVVEPPADLSTPDAYLPRERSTRVQSLLSYAGFVPTQPPVLVQAGPAQTPGSWGVVLAVAKPSN